MRWAHQRQEYYNYEGPTAAWADRLALGGGGLGALILAAIVC